ncbi:hypothetical protein [uncultured Clostridium sp.]|uniref:hypothetical protein n=1 Tax=uncultured Clostridium sp. TaxID=59620 RepID=UPI002629F186|nr:hypothetical protein [uncultured Clostridium sp.]
MKKKQGAALIWVLMIFTVLIITGTAIMVLITSANRIDNSSSIQSNLRIETYTGINLGEYYLVNEEKYKEITANNKEVILNKEEVINIANNLGEQNLIEGINKYDLNIQYKWISNNEYEITSVAKLNGQSYKQSKNIEVIESEETKIKKEIDSFMNNISGISILGEGTGIKDFNIERESNLENDSTWNLVLNNLGINIKRIKNIVDVTNEINNSKVNLTIMNCKNENSENGTDSKGLTLKFKSNPLKVDVNYLNKLNLISANPGDVILINGALNSNNIKLENEKNLTEEQIEESDGILVYLGGYVPSQKWALINNGNIIINSKLDKNASFNNMLIYSTKQIVLQGSLENQVYYIQWSDLIANYGICFQNTNIEMANEFNLTEKQAFRNILEKIVR